MRSHDGLSLLFLFLSLLVVGALAEQCGRQIDPSNPPCPDERCCSFWGWCSCTASYCTTLCQSNCHKCSANEDSIILNNTKTRAKTKDLRSVITPAQFENLLKNRSESNSHGGFYTYQAFITATKWFVFFGNNGPMRYVKGRSQLFLLKPFTKLQVDHLLLQMGHSRFHGKILACQLLSFIRFKSCFCHTLNLDAGLDIIRNFSYGEAGKAIGVDLISDPDLVVKDPVISFKAALWFWMNPQSPKPSPHDVMTKKWNPSPADKSANRLLGYGVITNIINGGLECGKAANQRDQDRIGLYTRYCAILGTHPGENLDCANQKSFGS